jgi:hypothetical protein
VPHQPQLLHLARDDAQIYIGSSAANNQTNTLLTNLFAYLRNLGGSRRARHNS